MPTTGNQHEFNTKSEALPLRVHPNRMIFGSAAKIRKQLLLAFRNRGFPRS
jgi:hypothetical protein